MFNVFRLLGDLSHISSKCILIWAIHWNKSAEGVSLLTQILYACVFVTRYLDIFTTRIDSWVKTYNLFFKIFYILSSFYIILLMTKVFPRTREREKAWKLALWSVIGSLVLSPIAILVLERNETHRSWFREYWWSFSIILESVCVLPQLLLLRQTTVPTVIDSFYLLTLGLYRTLYLFNWIERYESENFRDPIAVVFGIVQTAFYIDFAWVYWSRQRVKLRHGGIVDSEDFRKSWLVNKVFNSRVARARNDEEEEHLDEENGAAEEGAGRRAGTNRWGARGISVSADDTLEGHSHSKSRDSADDDELEGILDDEESSHDREH
ncbi:hypothetical protein Plec18167_003417 [Paecilomyces lecythidis]|uniref:ER lumen protein-retaining receptor n=1 Tax=Paecilomyces lecythidis TaxID=3004212 RepID=A0ABR3XZ17_9EURO